VKSAAQFFLALATAGAAVLGTGGPAYARDVCAGVVEIDGCEYCSLDGGALGESPSECDAGTPGYAWRTCPTWVTTACVYPVS
jgi:hypothetical protein